MRVDVSMPSRDNQRISMRETRGKAALGPRFQDGLGIRVVAVDESSGDTIEVLHLCPELSAYERSIKDRVSRLANFRHPRFVPVRSVERLPAQQKRLGIVSDHIVGARLAEILEASRKRQIHIDVNAALHIVRELLSAIGVLHESRTVTHGAIGPERLLVTPRGRLVIADYSLSLALERLQFSRQRLWREFQIPMPPSASVARFDHFADVLQIGCVTLALLVGRPLDLADLSPRLKGLLGEAGESTVRGDRKPLSDGLRSWLERILGVESRKPYTTVQQANSALEQLLLKEKRFGVTAAALKALAQRYTPGDADSDVVTTTATERQRRPVGPQREQSLQVTSLPAVAVPGGIEAGLPPDVLAHVEDPVARQILTAQFSAGEADGSPQVPLQTEPRPAERSSEAATSEEAAVSRPASGESEPAGYERLAESALQLPADRLEEFEPIGQLLAATPLAPAVAPEALPEGITPSPAAPGLAPPETMSVATGSTEQQLLDEGFDPAAAEAALDALQDRQAGVIEAGEAVEHAVAESDAAVEPPGVAEIALDGFGGADSVAEPPVAETAVEIVAAPVADENIASEPVTAVAVHLPTPEVTLSEPAVRAAIDVPAIEDAAGEPAIGVVPFEPGDGILLDQAALDDGAQLEAALRSCVELISEPEPVEAVAPGADVVQLDSPPVELEAAVLEAEAALEERSRAASTQAPIVDEAPVAIETDARCTTAESMTIGQGLAVEAIDEAPAAPADEIPAVPFDQESTAPIIATDERLPGTPEEACPEAVLVAANTPLTEDARPAETELLIDPSIFEVETLARLQSEVPATQLAVDVSVAAAVGEEIDEPEASVVLEPEAPAFVEPVAHAAAEPEPALPISTGSLGTPTEAAGAGVVETATPAAERTVRLTTVETSEEFVAARAGIRALISSIRAKWFTEPAARRAQAATGSTPPAEARPVPAPEMATPRVEVPTMWDSPVASEPVAIQDAGAEEAANAAASEAGAALPEPVLSAPVPEEPVGVAEVLDSAVDAVGVAYAPIPEPATLDETVPEATTSDAVAPEPALLDTVTTESTAPDVAAIEVVTAEAPTPEPATEVAVAIVPATVDAVADDVAPVAEQHLETVWTELTGVVALAAELSAGEVPTAELGTVEFVQDGLNDNPADVAAVEVPAVEASALPVELPFAVPEAVVLGGEEPPETVLVTVAEAAPQIDLAGEMAVPVAELPALDAVEVAADIPTEAVEASAVDEIVVTEAALVPTPGDFEALTVEADEAAPVTASEDEAPAPAAESAGILEFPVPATLWAGQAEPEPAAAESVRTVSALPVHLTEPTAAINLSAIRPAERDAIGQASAATTPVVPIAPTALNLPVGDRPLSGARDRVLSDMPAPVQAPQRRRKRAQPPVRWKRIGAIAASLTVIAVSGVQFATAHWFKPPFSTGSVTVESVPVGLQVFIDGEPRGTTPVTVTLHEGTHGLYVKGHGLTREMPVRVVAGADSVERLVWPAALRTGALRVETEPAGAKVFVDGTLRGVSPLTVEGLAVRAHSVVVEGRGSRVEQSVTISPENTSSIRVAVYSGWIQVDSVMEMDIREDGRSIGTTDVERIMLPAGRHTLEFVNERYGFRDIRAVDVRPGDLTRFAVNLPRGTIEIDAPAGVEVWLDGERVGETPVAPIEVPVGTHNVRLKGPDLDHHQVVVVGARAPARVRPPGR